MASLKDLGEIKFKELAVEMKRLNDSGLIAEKINAVGKTKEELVDLFVKAVQAIPDDENGNWTGPAETAEYYMSILADGDKKKNTIAKPEKKQIRKTANKSEKDTAVKEKTIGINEYGFREGSASAKASALIMSGEHTAESASETIEKEFKKTAAIAMGRVKMIVRALKRDKGLDPNWKI
jgi:hypothetical protein